MALAMPGEAGPLVNKTPVEERAVASGNGALCVPWGGEAVPRLQVAS